MADSMLSDLPSASEINDTDLLYAVVEGVSKKITKQVLFAAVTQVLSTKADLVQGVLALAQMRENMRIVLNDTARFALTTSDVKNGFIIIVQQDEHGVPYSPNPKMYIVVDDTKLDEEDGYQPFASDVDWSTIENKPDNIVFSGPALATENVPAIDAYLHKSDVVDNFTDGGTEVPLSAECGKLLNNTLTALGEVVRSPSNTTHTSIPSGDTEGTECATITLQPGIWVLVGKICWPPNATGYRQVSFQSAKNGARETSNVTVGVANKEVTQEVTYISTIATETTFKLYGMQTSGSNLDAYPHLSAFKIKNV